MIPNKKSTTFKTPKGTELPILDIHGKGYLQVAHRLVWFREDHPNWQIATEAVEINTEKRYAIFRATIKDDTDRTIATATKVETAAGFGDYVEKAETGSIGRSLALCGYGTQFAPEFDEGDRLADSPTAAAKPALDPKKKAIQETYAKKIGEAKAKGDAEEMKKLVNDYEKEMTGAGYKKIVEDGKQRFVPTNVGAAHAVAA